MPILEDGLSSGKTTDDEEVPPCITTNQLDVIGCEEEMTCTVNHLPDLTYSMLENMVNGVQTNNTQPLCKISVSPPPPAPHPHRESETVGEEPLQCSHETV